MFQGWCDLLEKLAFVAKSQKNACRALHCLVEKTGVCLPIPVHTTQITIRQTKPKVSKVQAWWPFFTMHS